jgi:hypothetical protein
MHRRLAGLLAMSAIALAACSAGATPAPTPIADASTIITQSLDALSKAQTVHVKADVTGTIPFDLSSLMGGGSGTPAASGGSMDLAGSYIEATVDINGKKGTATVALPVLLGLKADAIMDGDTSYTRINLMGDKWQKSVSSPEPGASPSPSQDAATMAAQLEKALTASGVTATKLANEKCGDVDCYHVQIKAPASALKGDASGLLSGLGGLGGGLGGLAGGITGSPAPGASPIVGGDVTIDWWAQTTDLRPAKIVLVVDAGGAPITITAVMDSYDKPVTVSPPPADQVTDNPGNLFPSSAP